MAEALVEVAEPLAGVVGIGPAGPAPDVARAMAAALAHQASPVVPPEWLMPSQRRSFARTRAALDRYGGALLAEPVGSGKSWIALALAASEAASGHGGRTATVLAPAALLPQWSTTSGRMGVPVALWSHERLSRGTIPQGRSGLVIIDESHRFRNPATRRYLTLAPWLAGRRVLLLSATPVVNRLADLGAQLLLGVPDDALRPFGCPSIRRELEEDRGIPALGEVVVQSITTSAGPGMHGRSIAIDPLVPESIVQGLDRLVCSRIRPIARLISGVAWRAAASSPAALLGVLSRYRTLLHHARDALGEDRPLDRARLREFAGELAEQMVMWGLVESPGQAATTEIELDDLPRLDGLIPEVRAWSEAGDAKLQRLTELLADRKPTLVFTVARDTVRYLRDRLPPPVAWSSGERAGLGATALPRPVVWSWFSPAGTWAGTGPRPSTLVSTDVAAEGLDLQRAGRVVHYDLPWTEVRMAQRNGRAARLGSLHERVHIVRFVPPPEIERRLNQERILGAKAGLPDCVGLGAKGRELWQWRDFGGQGGRWALKDSLAAGAQTGAPQGRSVAGGQNLGGCSAITAPGLTPGALIGVSLTAGDSSHRAPILLWMPENGEAVESVAECEVHLQAALAAESWEAPTQEELNRVRARLWPALRTRMAQSERGRWRSGRPTLEIRGLVRRLHRLARQAARRRDAHALAAVDRGLRFARQGHTAGEELIAAELLAASDRALLERLASLPCRDPRLSPLVPEVTGVLVFR